MPPFAADCGGGVIVMDDRRPSVQTELRVDPSRRLCPQFDATGIALFPVADRGEMGMRVLDNCCEEHIQ